MSREDDKYQVLPNGKKVLKNATPMDIILSVIVPIFGLIIGIYALIKGEKKRGFTLLGDLRVGGDGAGPGVGVAVLP